ncbi:hypothetical protein ACFQ1S_02300 [Kibdelosporangium lantanae]|uniref:Uncharacterized protein n=1 Tax=Kibdelosporangium lantanae TaxID=1497396 RepID=A0ABW3M3G3_9PSEU
MTTDINFPDDIDEPGPFTYAPDGIDETTVNALMAEMDDLTSEPTRPTTALLDGTAVHRRDRRIARRVIREVVALKPTHFAPNPGGWAA